MAVNKLQGYAAVDGPLLPKIPVINSHSAKLVLGNRLLCFSWLFYILISLWSHYNSCLFLVTDVLPSKKMKLPAFLSEFWLDQLLIKRIIGISIVPCVWWPSTCRVTSIDTFRCCLFVILKTPNSRTARKVGRVKGFPWGNCCVVLHTEVKQWKAWGPGQNTVPAAGGRERALPNREAWN